MASYLGGESIQIIIRNGKIELKKRKLYVQAGKYRVEGETLEELRRKIKKYPRKVQEDLNLMIKVLEESQKPPPYKKQGKTTNHYWEPHIL